MKKDDPQHPPIFPYEHETTEPLRVENDNEGECWLRGYADGYHGRDLNTPARHVESYLRGFIAGLLSLRAR